MEHLLDKRPGPSVWETSSSGDQFLSLPSWAPRTLAHSGESLINLPKAHVPASLSLGETTILKTSHHASFQGFADFPLSPPPSLMPGSSLGTSEAVSSHHSNCPSHQQMEITFHDGSSDVAIFCVDQNNKTNQTLGI